ncbi:electron transfer flavoprotein-ubiquinone oxidoreductase [Vibrio maritimus]|uniref:electron transfer flavoprotein-ubiquinone oxidoreductase n=1 Tax=Vibrio maritimus TaxID=990268 RepID=UPI001F273DB8|nr:electron transfer flavoprotein-ubiquinone oxidoreductase [Vibrio maritimus]
MERESMEFDVVIVGAGPAGLSAAIRLAQLSHDQNQTLSVCVIEKGSEVGAHILSGALFETRALDELLPDWREMNAPIANPVCDDEFIYLTTHLNHLKVPSAMVPCTLKNSSDNHAISLGKLCSWLAQQAEQLGVEIFPGFAASKVLYDSEQRVIGVQTTDMGLDKQGEKKPTFEPGINLLAKYTVFAEGSRGHLGKSLINKFSLDKNKQPQHYALGFKELWQLPDDHPHYSKGKVLHGVGWPLSESGTTGGSFLYHMESNQVAVGLIVDLNYSNPHLNLFEEFQRFKHHRAIAKYLQGGERVCFGARAITKGGIRSLPKQQFPGGLLIGCDAGTLNMGKIKGSHTAMKSGMIAAEAIFEQISAGLAHQEADYQTRFESSWLYKELASTRNFGANLHKFGEPLGGLLNVIEQNWWSRLFKTPIPWKVTDNIEDHMMLKMKDSTTPINYQKPDGVLSFDKPSSLFLSGTQHEENQPCHLHLTDPTLVLDTHIPLYNEPSQRYCPAGVYEIVDVEGKRKLQINATNCLHCKTCDIKDPSANIDWTAPEGGGGPSYRGM